jgi:hypothetical protein
LKLVQVQPIKESRIRSILRHFFRAENMSRDQIEILQYIVSESDMGLDLESEFVVKLIQYLGDRVYAPKSVDADLQEYIGNHSN